MPPPAPPTRASDLQLAAASAPGRGQQQRHKQANVTLHVNLEHYTLEVQPGAAVTGWFWQSSEGREQERNHICLRISTLVRISSR